MCCPPGRAMWRSTQRVLPSPTHRCLPLTRLLRAGLCVRPLSAVPMPTILDMPRSTSAGQALATPSQALRLSVCASRRL